MKKFEFKLQGLLNIKKAVEREVRFELMEIQTICRQQQQKIEETETKVKGWSDYYSLVMKSSGKPQQLAVIDRHIQGLYRYREQLEISLEVYERKRESVIEQYDEIRKEVKAIEHLRERKFEDYLAERRRYEDKLNDEVATLRYAREKVAV